jgi:translation initiation factor 1A
MYNKYRPTMEEEIARIKMPRDTEMFGLATEMLGSGRFRADCIDGIERLCRIPGKLRRRVWIKVGDLIVLKPWEIEPNKKADVVWRYTRTQAMWLKRQNRIGDLLYG